MNNNRNYNNEQHPEHPVRNFFFCVFCFFFSIAFSYLWVWQMFDFDYTWLAILIASLIIAGAVIGVIVSFTKSHRNYYSHSKGRQKRYYR